MDQPKRIEILRSYVAALAADMAARGEFSAGGASSIDAAVSALVKGGSAMASQLAADLKVLGGIGLAAAKPIAEGLLADAAERAARAAVGRAGAVLGDLFRSTKTAKPTRSELVKREKSSR